MIIFWPDVHSNIFILPFKLFIASLADVTFGTPWGLLDGEFYQTINTPRNYLIINLVMIRFLGVTIFVNM